MVDECGVLKTTITYRRGFCEVHNVDFNMRHRARLYRKQLNYLGAHFDIRFQSVIVNFHFFAPADIVDTFDDDDSALFCVKYEFNSGYIDEFVVERSVGE